MAIQVKKSDLIIVLLALVVVIAGLFTLFVSCQDMTDGGEGGESGGSISGGLPVARIVKDDVDALPGVTFGDYQFKLEGETYTGALDSPENIAALKDTYQKWLDYESFLEPAPFRPPAAGSPNKQFNIWQGSPLKLDNSLSVPTLVIQRYWNSTWGALTTENWKAQRDGREAAFKAATEQLETMRAEIKASQFYEVSYNENALDVFPLKNLYNRMGDFIAVGAGATLYVDRPTWGDSERNSAGTILDKSKTGPLYELYFGPVPGKDDYLYPDNTAGFAYPDDTP
jgi:hypothetical protein